MGCAQHMHRAFLGCAAGRSGRGPPLPQGPSRFFPLPSCGPPPLRHPPQRPGRRPPRTPLPSLPRPSPQPHLAHGQARPHAHALQRGAGGVGPSREARGHGHGREVAPRVEHPVHAHAAADVAVGQHLGHGVGWEEGAGAGRMNRMLEGVWRAGGWAGRCGPRHVRGQAPHPACHPLWPCCTAHWSSQGLHPGPCMA